LLRKTGHDGRSQISLVSLDELVPEDHLVRNSRIGWIYVYGMTAVAVSALYMGLYRIFLDADKTTDSVAFAWFLIFISILSGASAWYGIRVLRYKKRTDRHRVAIDIAFPALLLMSGIVSAFMALSSILP
jgi:hypothetical protein